MEIQADVNFRVGTPQTQLRIVSIFFNLASLPFLLITFVLEEGLDVLIAKIQRLLQTSNTSFQWAMDHAVYIRKR